MNILKLSSGELRLGVVPQLGGALAWLQHGGFDLLRPWDRTPSVRRTACFPLVPYSNRIAHGRFSHEGATWQLPRNFGEHPHPLHGVGWQREWQVLEQDARACTLVLAHEPRGQGGEHWPFAFQARQQLSLDDDGLSLSLQLRNAGTGAMPAGLGWHPYFSRHQGVEVQFQAARVWLNGDDALPSLCTDVPAHWAFDRRRPMGPVGLDNCFEGWRQPAQVYWPHARLGLELHAEPGLDYLVVFTPPAPQDFIAVEPVSHLNNAINSASPAANGIVWLAPGQSMERRLRLNLLRGALGAST
ncbi:MAG: aldose 1-epimerase [Pseudomonas sp.]|nr:aldose 1-epimerase [Pseudomonas sp.]